MIKAAGTPALLARLEVPKVMSDLLFIGLTVALFALLDLVVRGVSKL